jgi:hypothetical protein
MDYMVEERKLTESYRNSCVAVSRMLKVEGRGGLRLHECGFRR